MNHKMACVAALLAAAAGAPAPAQTIYRCGDQYGIQPCDGARAVAPAAPPPTADERAQAREIARRDAALATSMEKERLRQEAQAAKAVPGHLPPPAHPEPAPHKWPEKAGTRKLDVFTAVAPGSAKPKPKASGKDTKGAGAATAVR